MGERRKLVLLRAGQTVWNGENKFTGWVDVDLSQRGEQEAIECGKIFKEKNLKFDIVFTSVLKRAIKTTWLALAESDNYSMPIFSTWRLNERHYGRLQGLNKWVTAQRYGEAQVKTWRRSYDVLPPPMDASDPGHPANDAKYDSLPPDMLPGSESLKSTIDRVLPVWCDQIAPVVRAGKTVLVTGHGNSLRAICAYLEHMSPAEVLDFNIPMAVPLVYELDENSRFLEKYYLMDPDEVAKRMLRVATLPKDGTLTEDLLTEAPYNQGHLFEGASAEVKLDICKQLTEVDKKLAGGGLGGYLARARNLLRDAKMGTNPFAGLTPKMPDGANLTGSNGPGSAAFAEFEKIGMANLPKCAFCLVAGGLGERLGFPGIKIGITSEVTTGKTFIEYYCKYILAFQAEARKSSGDKSLELPLAIMTSGDTHAQTVAILDKHCRFGLSPAQVNVMKQEKVPALTDVEARISVKNGVVETKPHGHGDVHALLHQTGLMKKWTSEGREWLAVFQDTNPLAFRCLCATVGVSAKNNFLMNSVAVPRIPGEACGCICHLVDSSGMGFTINVEYNELVSLLKDTPLGGDVADATGFSPYPGNINFLVFKVPDMARCLESTGGIVREFVNPKWADATRSKFKSATRLECMMQDFPRLCSTEDKCGFTMLDRWMCFTCVKNALADAAKKKPPDCALSAEADIYNSNVNLLKLAGGNVTVEDPEVVSFMGITSKIGARVILEPSFGVCLEAMKGKVKGTVKVSKKSSLVLDGDLTIDGLNLDGALRVEGSGVLKDKIVKNDGAQIVAIADADLADMSPSLQIRGYMVAVGKTEETVVIGG